MAINGNMYDWESITAMLPHGVAAGITEITYEDEQPVTAHYGKGSLPRGYGRGNYAASGQMVLDRDEFERLKVYLVASGGGSIYDHRPFPVIVSYATKDMPPMVDVLKSCKIGKITGGGGSQGEDKVTAITCEFTILEAILWNTAPAKLDSVIPGL